MSDKLIISAIKTELCYFIQLKRIPGQYYSYSHGSGLAEYYFDGELPAKTYNGDWVKIPKLPKLIEKNVPPSYINPRFELIDKSLASNSIPFSFKNSEVIIDDDGNWDTKFAHLRSLYEFKHDIIQNPRVVVDFEFEVICEIDNIKEYAGLSYPVQRGYWESEGTVNLTESSVKHQTIDTIVFPALVLPSKPCELSSHDTYKIIRQHIKEEINPKVAVISSDYNFCVTVKKLIQLETPESYQVNLNSVFSKKKPRYTTRYRTTREIQVFEMTYDGEGGNYKGYTPIKGFRGKSHEDLKKVIDEYLENLMKMINEPLADCECCKGLGVKLIETK